MLCELVSSNNEPILINELYKIANSYTNKIMNLRSKLFHCKVKSITLLLKYLSLLKMAYFSNLNNLLILKNFIFRIKISKILRWHFMIMNWIINKMLIIEEYQIVFIKLKL